MAIFTQTGRIQKDEGTRSSSPSRSVSIEENGALSSSGSEKFGKSSNLVGTREQSKDDELEIQGGGLLKRKKRLDAHSYRASLKPVAKRTNNSVGGRICRKVTDGEGDITKVCSSPKEGFGTSVRAESTSGGRSLADVNMESDSEVRPRKKAKLNADLDSDISVTQKSSTTDAASSTSGSGNNSMEECSACNKLLRTRRNKGDWIRKLKREDLFSDKHHKKTSRVINDVEDREICICNAETRHSLSISVSKAGGEIEVMDTSDIAEGHLNSSYKEEFLMGIQTDSGRDACVICKCPGLLLCCHGKGCKRSYHLSCLDLPMKDVPPGVWHCLYCVKKKIELGVYSVSEGIDSIWDSKEGIQNEKHYFVKYKGLAHVHNRWIPESLMLLDAPTLLAEFNKQHQKKKVWSWKKEWTKPHRLLLKRFLMPRKQTALDFYAQDNKFPFIYHEWLVKWKGLDYEHSTWELENSSFLCSPEGLILIKDYERRCEQARKASDPSRTDKALLIKNNPLCKLSKLPDGCLEGFNDDYLSSINLIREFWHRSQSAVFIDDLERIIKSILFILSLVSHTCQPFLIITTTNLLPSWEAELIRLAPLINFVVYNGNKNVRKTIQTLEFYEEGGCIMFQVLLSHPEAIVEDLGCFDCIGWEAIIVDECQNLRMSMHFEQFRNLSSDFRLLLLSGSLETDVEYFNVLSFLDPKGQENPVNNSNLDYVDSCDTLAILKERLAWYIAYGRKPKSSKFVEYWVPVQLSALQLERYCGILMSNSLSLCSQSKRDNAGVLRDILLSNRKCCDHPYLVDESLRSSIVKGIPRAKYLDDEVNASGKLQLLDRILHDIKNRGLRVLILFQPTDVAQRISIGDILDDFLRERYGADSYERVDKGMIASKKQASLNMFNDKSSGRFVFLIETRACVPSIKLSSLDAAIIYNCDWNPLNDSRALQKISIDSQIENLLVLRLYSSFTVEEKILIFAKQHIVLESNVQHLSSSVCHSLLGWGASHLFSKLDEFHQLDNTSHVETFATKLLLNDLFELLIQVPKADAADRRNHTTLTKAQHNGVSYTGDIVLAGEKGEFPLLVNEPYVFWSELLERNTLQLRFIAGSSEWKSKGFELFDEFANEVGAGSDGLREKCTEVACSGADPLPVESWLEDTREEPAVGKDATFSKEAAPCSSDRPLFTSTYQARVCQNIAIMELEAPRRQSNVGSQHFPSSATILNDTIHNLPMPSMPLSTSETTKHHMPESEEGENFHNVQKKLHSFLKTDLLKLCETLRFPKDVKDMAEMLLKYTVKNDYVSLQPENILQAFILSLCWIAACLLKYKVNRKESLVLAKKYLNFNCRIQEIESFYERLKILNKEFSDKVGSKMNSVSSNCLEDHSSLPRQVVVEVPIPKGRSEKEPSDHLEPEEGETIDDQSSLCVKDVPENLMKKNSERVSSDDEELEEGEIRGTQTHNCSEPPVSAELEVAPVLEIPVANVQTCTRDEPLKKQIELIDKIYLERFEKLLSEQKRESEELKSQEYKQRLNFKRRRDLDLNQIHARHTDPVARSKEKKMVYEEFAKNEYEFDRHIKSQRRNLVVLQVNARNKEKQVKNIWLEEAKAGKLAESFHKLPLSDSGFQMEKFEFSGKSRLHDGPENTIVISGPSSDQQSIDVIAKRPMDSINTAEVSAQIPAIIPSLGMADMSMETETPASNSSGTNAVRFIAPRPSTESLASVPLECDGNMLNQTEIPATQSKVTNEFSKELEGTNISSVTPVIGDNEKYRATDSDGKCLARETEFISPSHASGSSGCDKSSLCNQVLPITEQERTSVSDRLGSNQGFTSPEHTVVPTVHSVDGGSTQVGPTDHEETVSVPILLLPPPSGGLTSVVNGHACASVPVRTEEACTTVPVSTEETRNQTHCSPHQTDILLQQPVVTMAAQVEQSVSQFIAHPMPSPVNIPQERTESEFLRTTDIRPEAGCHFPQILTMLQSMPAQKLHPDPLMNELMRLTEQKDLFTRMHEDKKLQLKLEREKQIEMVRKKHDTLIQDVDTEFFQKITTFDIIYNKVTMNQSLAEKFRAKFVEVEGGTAIAFKGASSGSVPLHFRALQPQLAQIPLSTSPHTPSPAATAFPLALSTSPFSSVRLHAPASVSLPLVQANYFSAVFPSNPERPHFRAILPSHANLQAGSGTRSPAPHLRALRPYISGPTTNLPPQTVRMENQQQLINQSNLAQLMDLDQAILRTGFARLGAQR